MAELLFDRKLLRQNKQRIADKFCDHNFLYHEISDILFENIEDQNLQFKNALEISAQDEYLANLVLNSKKVQKLTQSFLFQSQNENYEIDKLIADDEFLPFKPEIFDLVLSNLNLHHVNIVPQFLLDVKKILQKEGIFIASFFGENNLLDLKQAVFDAENSVFGQVSPRFIPVIDVKNAAMLLQKAGFSNPVASLEVIEVEYKNPLKLLEDIKFMGQGNILLKKDKKFANRKFLDEILKNYVKINLCALVL